MKKTKLISLLALIPLIAGCGNVIEQSSSEGNESSSVSSDSGSGSQSSTNTSSIEEKTWTDAELAIFQNNLYGYVLPYYEMTGNVVEFDDENEAIVVSGAQSTPEDLKAWADLLVDDGFVLYDDEDNYYVLEKEITVEGETRFLAVDMASLDGDGYVDETGSGTFMLMMGDPYYYDWPTDIMAAIVEVFDDTSTTVIPAFEADYYSFNINYISFGIAAIYCYTDSLTAEEDYSTTLETAGWTILEDRDADGYLVAVSPDEKIEVQYYYDEDYKDLDIYVAAHEIPNPWPTDEIASIVNKWTDNSGTVIPEFADAKNTTLITEYFGYDLYELFGYYLIYAETNNANAEIDYANTLETAGWEVSYDVNEEMYFAVSANEDILLQFFYDPDYQELDIYFSPYVPSLTSWPTDELASYLEQLVPGTETVIPAFEAEEYVINFHEEYEIIVVQCAGQEDGALDAYVAALEIAGWNVTEDLTYYDDYHCVSPNQDVEFEIYLTSNDTIQFEIVAYEAPSAQWPSQDVADLLEANGGNSTIIEPTYEGITGFEILDDGYGIGVIVFVEEGSEDEAIASYESQLEGAGWEVVGDYYGSPLWNLAGCNVSVDCYTTYDGWYTIEISITLGVEDAFALWAQNTGYTDTVLPDLEFTVDAEVTFEAEDDPESYYGIYFDLLIYAADEDLETVFNELVTALTEAGYTLSGTFADGYAGGSDNTGDLEVYISVETEDGLIYFDLCEPVAW